MVRPIEIEMIYLTMHHFSNMFKIIKEGFETQKLLYSNTAALIFQSLWFFILSLILFCRLQSRQLCTTNSDTQSNKEGTTKSENPEVQGEDTQKVIDNLKADGEKLKTEAKDFKVNTWQMSSLFCHRTCTSC